MTSQRDDPDPQHGERSHAPPAVDRPAEDRARAFFPDPDIVARAVENAGIGIWAWDISANTIAWSRNLAAIHRMQGGFDGTFASFEQDIHPDDRGAVLAAIKTAIETGGPYAVMYRLPARPGEDERWITATGTVALADGAPKTLFGICRDVTQRTRTERELRMRAHRQEIVAQLGARALAEEDLQTLLDDIATIVATMLDVDLVNILELVPGDTELLLRAGYGWKPNTVKVARLPISPGSQANYTLSAFGPVLVSDLPSETRFRPSPFLLDHDVVSGMSTTIVGHDRRKYGIFSVHTRYRRSFTDYDVALLSSVANIIAGAIQRRQLDQRQKMMIRELHHRSGNLFSQMLALLSQTASTSKSIADLVPKYQARVLALANANRLMVEGGWQPAPILDLLNAQLAACLDRMALTGPNVHLEPALAFALSSVAHELISNALKHGALSARSGRVDVQWSVGRTDQGVALVFDWNERGGPAPRRRVRSGFGSRLISTVIKRQMGGNVRRTFKKDGLRVRLTIPLTHERWPEAAVIA